MKLFQRLSSRMKNRLSNRGSTFVIVITTIGFVGLVTSLVLMVTSMGYQIKQVDNQSKNNFYSAEEIVDQIKAGIHNDMSKAIMRAYFKILADAREDYLTASDTAARQKALENVNKDFKKEAIGDGTKGFVKTIKDKSKSGNIVSKDVLFNYLSEEYKDSKDPATIINIAANGTKNITYEYDENEYKYITLKDIYISYVNELGYSNNLYTDIRVTIPDIKFDFLDFDRNLAFADYTLMSATDINYDSSGSTNTSTGILGSYWMRNNFNVVNAAKVNALGDYGYIQGNLNITVDSKTQRASDSYGKQAMFQMNMLNDANGKYNANFNLVRSGSAATNFTLSNYMDSHKGLYGTQIYDGSKTKDGKRKVTMKGTYLTVGDIIMNGNSRGAETNVLATDAKLYVRNDMQLNVDYAKATIWNMYKGYGYTAGANTSSSIILNNKNCNLQMELSELDLLGSAYIKTNALGSNDYSFPCSLQDVLTGDSLIIRGNQIAYLVPAKYVPTFNTNPVTIEEGNANGKDLKKFEETVAGAVRAVPELIQYLKYDDPVRTIFYSYKGGNSWDVAYYYLNFKDGVHAADYYQSVIRNAAGSISPVSKDGQPFVSDETKNTLLGLIPATINVKIDSMADSTIRSNVITALDSGNDGIKSGTTPQLVSPSQRSNGTNAGKLASETVETICRFLQDEVPKTLEDDAKAGNVNANEYFTRDAMDNIIDWKQVHNEPSGHLINSTHTTNGYQVSVVLTNNDLTFRSSGNNTSQNRGLFITTGNITIQDGAEVKGLFIAGYKKGAAANGGKITIGHGCRIESLETCIEDIFRNSAAFKTTKGVLFSDIFRGYEYDEVVGEAKDFYTQDGAVINLNKMFTYENWSKQ